MKNARRLSLRFEAICGVFSAMRHRPGSKCGGEGGVHGLDGCIEFYEQGNEAAEHDCGEERDEKRGFVHGCVLSGIAFFQRVVS